MVLVQIAGYARLAKRRRLKDARVLVIAEQKVRSCIPGPAFRSWASGAVNQDKIASISECSEEVRGKVAILDPLAIVCPYGQAMISPNGREGIVGLPGGYVAERGVIGRASDIRKGSNSNTAWVRPRAVGQIRENSRKPEGVNIRLRRRSATLICGRLQAGKTKIINTPTPKGDGMGNHPVCFFLDEIVIPQRQGCGSQSRTRKVRARYTAENLSVTA